MNDSNNHKLSENNPNNDEIDLKELGRLIKNIIVDSWEGAISVLIAMFGFFRKNWFYLLLGALLGLGWAIFNYSTFSSQKVYKMIVSPNSISRMFLYDKIRYYEENKEEKEFTIAIEPIKDYKESMEILLNKLGTDNKDVLEKIKIEEYISSIKKFEYNNHVIMVYSDKEIDTEKVQDQIISTVENSTLIMKRQKEELEILSAEKKRIEANLSNIDQTIKKDLQSERSKIPSSGILVENSSEADIFNVYQKLSNKLAEVERQIDKQKETLQVLSDLSYIGETQFMDNSFSANSNSSTPKKSSSILGFGKFVFSGFVIVLGLILGLNILRYFIKRT
ncbi:MAG: hypothetical protein ACK5MD_01590 [Flavobacteriales bacterium]